MLTCASDSKSHTPSVTHTHLEPSGNIGHEGPLAGSGLQALDGQVHKLLNRALVRKHLLGLYQVHFPPALQRLLQPRDVLHLLAGDDLHNKQEAAPAWNSSAQLPCAQKGQRLRQVCAKLVPCLHNQSKLDLTVGTQAFAWTNKEAFYDRSSSYRGWSLRSSSCDSQDSPEMGFKVKSGPIATLRGWWCAARFLVVMLEIKISEGRAVYASPLIRLRPHPSVQKGCLVCDQTITLHLQR